MNKPDAVQTLGPGTELPTVVQVWGSGGQEFGQAEGFWKGTQTTECYLKEKGALPCVCSQPDC